MKPEEIAPVSPSGPLQAGYLFAGRYEVVQQLGTGGTSSVYQVIDQLPNEIIALKIIHQSAAQNPKLLENFKRELSVARRLSHRNVVRIFDIGEHGGQFYISMEYVEGRTIAALLKQRTKLTPEQFHVIFNQFCEGLAYVHSQNVIHRDIKPQNVMAHKDGTLKLMDFGVARDASALPTMGIVLGTPAYMAPEQIMGKPLTRATDIFSAGSMFYEMLTGQKAFGNMHFAERCAAPPPAFPADTDVSPILQEAIRQCLEPDPERRFATVEALVKAVGSSMMSPVGSSTASNPVSNTGAKRSGKTLSSLLSPGPANPDTTVPVFVRAMERLAEIHREKRVHYGLSPKKIWILPDGTVQIDSSQTHNTGTIAISDPKYASQDIYSADDAAARNRADVYSIGFMLYEVLLGERLFAQHVAVGLQSDSDVEWLKWHADLEQHAPRLTDLLPGGPSSTLAIVDRMISKRPADRIATLEEAVASLKAPPIKVDLVTAKTRQPAPGPATVPTVNAPSPAGAPAPVLPITQKSEPIPPVQSLADTPGLTVRPTAAAPEPVTGSKVEAKAPHVQSPPIGPSVVPHTHPAKPTDRPSERKINEQEGSAASSGEKVPSSTSGLFAVPPPTPTQTGHAGSATGLFSSPPAPAKTTDAPLRPEASSMSPTPVQPAPLPPPKTPYTADPVAGQTEPAKNSNKRLIGAGVGAVLAVVIITGLVLSKSTDTSAPVTSDTKQTQTAQQPTTAVPAPPKAEHEYLKTIETPTGVMVLVPEGEYIVGPKDNPGKPVKFPAFYLDKTEVTNGAYKKFAAATGKPMPKAPAWDKRYFDNPDFPVLNVSWQDAHDFAAWAGKRLPTEAEWDRAARGMDGRTYPWGNWSQNTAANLKGADDGHRFAAPVGSFPYDESSFGAVDMEGNVQEWVDGDFGPGQKVIRGGGFDSEPEQTTASRRAGGPLDLDPKGTALIGFRCAADPQAALNAKTK